MTSVLSPCPTLHSCFKHECLSQREHSTLTPYNLRCVNFIIKRSRILSAICTLSVSALQRHGRARPAGGRFDAGCGAPLLRAEHAHGPRALDGETSVALVAAGFGRPCRIPRPDCCQLFPDQRQQVGLLRGELPRNDGRILPVRPQDIPGRPLKCTCLGCDSSCVYGSARGGGVVGGTSSA